MRTSTAEIQYSPNPKPEPLFFTSIRWVLRVFREAMRNRGGAT